MRRLKLTKERRQRFLQVLTETGIVRRACEAVSVGRSTAYDLRRRDAAFGAEWETAEQIAADRLEEEAFRRGVLGVAEPLVSAGKLVRNDEGQPMTIQRYSDTLLIKLLQARRPEQFRENVRIEHDISDRVADRLEAARLRMLGTVIDVTPEPGKQ